MVEWTGRMRDRLIQERSHDTYKASHKIPEPAVCPDCNAVFHNGRWDWAERPDGAHETRCPACARIHDRYPAGYINLRGGFLHGHRAEIVNLVRNIETREKMEHPLKRIMDVEDEDGGILITTTDIHLAKSIGDAIYHAYEGELEYKFTDESNILHVAWER